MPMIRLSSLLVLVAWPFAAAPVAASPPAAACLPEVSAAWIRMPPANLPMMAGYARITNPCVAAVTIVSAGSAAFASTSLHETRLEAGISRMRATPSLTIPAGGDATLAPGGFHLMLMQPRAPLQVGQQVSVTFVLKDGRKLSVPFEVRAIR